ncbi:MAG: cytochrome-c peroxidase [Minicystis sp.]
MACAAILTAAATVVAAGCEHEAYPVLTTPSSAPLRAPPLSGGTLIVLRDGKTAVAGDAERNQLYVVDLAGPEVIATVPLDDADEPGRMAEDGAGHVHVAMRRGGLLTIDPRSGKKLARRDVCPAPRGIAYDASVDGLHVACVGGELVTLPAKGGAPSRTLQLDRDLRDVVVADGKLYVSLFRSAKVLEVSPDGAVTARHALKGITDFSPAVAWRMTAVPGGGVAIAHQRAKTSQIVLSSAPTVPYYDANWDGCEGAVVQSTVSRLTGDGVVSAAGPRLPGAALPVDIAFSPDGSRVAVIAAGAESVFEGPADRLDPSDQNCSTLKSKDRTGAIAVAYDAAGNLVVQTREPLLWVGERRVSLIGDFADPGARNKGHELFHRPPSGRTAACASCHPEGREDGHVWRFSPIGARRTQALAGDVTDTAPFHWGGDIDGFDELISEVLQHRMGGGAGPVHEQGEELQQWLATIPAVPASPPADPAAVERGRLLFGDPTVACTECHAGPKLTNNESKDVGTGETLQVPWLVGVAARAPFMHDGCAATLRDRFGACGGGDEHGKTSHLTPEQIDDLVAYLESL